MAFCTKCGKQLNEGDRFCYHCGEPISEIKQEKETVDAPGNSQELIMPTGVENKSESHKKGLIIAGIAVLGLVVILLLVYLFKGGSFDGGKELTDDSNYVNYTNNTVFFSVDYPKGYMVTEPNNNNVLITESEQADFQVSIEYAYHTVSNSAIYSAEDFANQAETSPKVLTDWLGSDAAQILSTTKSNVANRECYEYDFQLVVDGHPHTGALYIFDGDGDFGCYSYLWVVNEDAENAALYKQQCETMKESFQITGKCQAEGYSIYSYNELDMQIMVRDDAMGKTNSSENSVVIYPVSDVFVEANIWFNDSAFKAEETDASKVLETKSHYYFEYKDNTRYLSQPVALDYGRYPFTGVDLEYYDHGQKFTVSIFAFVHDEYYWTITMESTDEYYNTAALAVSDVLFSLKFGSGNSADLQETENDMESVDTETAAATTETDSASVKDMVTHIISDIRGKSVFNSDSFLHPLAVCNDFNGDGIQELLAVYEIQRSDAQFDVVYDLWSLPTTGAVRLKSDVLFVEVGGNSGIIGIVESKGVRYLAIERYEPDAEIFNNYYFYFPWDTVKSTLTGTEINMESHGSYDAGFKGRYIIGNESVDKGVFEANQGEFTDWLYEINILGGPGEGDVMAFDDLLSSLK